MNLLDAKIAPKQFVEFIKENLPNFYECSIEQELSFFEVISILHEESFCNETHNITPDSDLECNDLHEYLHSLLLAVKINKARIETLYSGL